jgi:hypothetical protein
MGRTLLLLDGPGSHHIDEFLQIRAGQVSDVLFLVPHSSAQTHPLDFLTFALMKTPFSGSRISRLESQQLNRLFRIRGACNGSNAPYHSIETFKEIGLTAFEEPLGSEEYYLSVQYEKARPFDNAPDWRKSRTGSNDTGRGG